MTTESFNQVLSNVHSPTKCQGQFCTIHNPSEHHMRDWPWVLRSSTLIERVCSHGVGHPDPDSWPVLDKIFGHRPGTWATHGCDGCCSTQGGSA